MHCPVYRRSPRRTLPGLGLATNAVRPWDATGTAKDPGATAATVPPSRFGTFPAMDLRPLIRTIPDHPKPGIQFRDVTTLIADPAGFAASVQGLAAPHRNVADGPTLVAGIEARGFIFGAALALELDLGFLPLRKPGKLPGETIGRDYALEYGEDRIEMHVDAFEQGARILLVDDLIATGGTAEAAVLLLREAGALVVECAFVVDLPDLGGAARLEKLGCSVRSLCAFEGE